MSRNTSILNISRTSDTINRVLGATVAPAGLGGTTGHSAQCLYNQNEDQFIVLPGAVFIPGMPVHQTMDDFTPPEGYETIIEDLVSALATLCPRLIAGTTWFFDPVDIHTPKFFRIVNAGGIDYLYLLIIDLTCRPLECRISEEGTNRRTHAFWTDRLYFECDWFPLESASGETLSIKQSIPFTWKGEAGQGYMVHGLWMDADINKFFSKLILPAGKRNYPYYPMTCKQHCVSMNAFGQSGPGLLHEIRQFIEPDLDEILETLHLAPFSETLDIFKEIKQRIPAELGKRWDNLSVSIALNDREQKEYTVAF